MSRLYRPQSWGIICFLAAALTVGLTGCGGDGSGAAEADGGADDRSAAPGAAPVRPGILVLLEDSLHLVRGRRVALVTNHTGIARSADGEIRTSIDLLYQHPEVELVALFGPEHGIRGQEVGGVQVDSSVDPVTGVPVHSVYGAGELLKPTREQLAGVDVLLFDIQDIGSRYYTYVWTMTRAMEGAGDAGIPFVVLDRPNPIRGDVVQGNVLDPAFRSAVGRFPVPMRHGLTPGELAQLVRGEYALPRPGAPGLAAPSLGALDLTVVPADGWRRDRSFVETGLPWVATSPNMPDVESALHYAGTCLFEGTVLSVGRGTEIPFQVVGHPGLDASRLARALNDRTDLADARFEPVAFVPESPDDGKFAGENVQGVRLFATGPAYDPTRAALAVLVEARAQLGGAWGWTGTMDRLAGTDAIRRDVEAGATLAELTSGWDDALRDFREQADPYLLYR